VGNMRVGLPDIVFKPPPPLEIACLRKEVGYEILRGGVVIDQFWWLNGWGTSQ